MTGKKSKDGQKKKNPVFLIQEKLNIQWSFSVIHRTHTQNIQYDH